MKLNAAIALAGALTLTLLSPPTWSAATDPLARDAVVQQRGSSALLLSAANAGTRVVAVGERGLVKLSDDYGKTWRQARKVPVSVTLTAVKFAGATAGWAVGHGGVVLHSADGGETWTRQLDGVQAAKLALQRAESLQKSGAANAARLVAEANGLVADGADKPFLDLDIIDAQHVIVAGAYGIVFATADGGASWESWIDRVDNPKALHLYAVAASRGGRQIRLVGEQGLVAQSDDGGRRFARIVAPYAGSWFSMTTTDDGGFIAVGLRGNAYVVDHTGSNWTRLQGVPPLSFTASAAITNRCTLLANQVGHLYVADKDSDRAELLAAPPLPPITAVTRLSNGTWLALTTQGAFNLGRFEHACSSPSALDSGKS